MSLNMASPTYWSNNTTNPEIIPHKPITYFETEPKSDFFQHPMFLLNTIIKEESEFTPPSYELDSQPRFTTILAADPSSQDINSKPKCIYTLCSKDISDNKDDCPKPTTKERPFSCTDCQKTFLLKHHLTTHLRVHSGVRPHSCSFCGKTFTLKHCLNTHLKLHSSIRPFECKECKKSFTLKHHLITHLRVHKREKLFVCIECGQAFALKRHLITHSKFHAGERPYICDKCGESFAKNDHLVMHARFHGSISSFHCSECGEKFTRKFELVNHQRLHGKERFFCPVCNREFSKERSLSQHLRNHSTTTSLKHDPQQQSTINDADLKSYTCNICNASFNSLDVLESHMKIHIPLNHPINNNNNTSKFQINSILVETKTENTQLNYYSSNFTNNQNYNVPATVSNPPNKKYPCDKCPKIFTAKHGLKQHIRKNPNGECGIRSHQCDICHKGFFQRNHLLLHQRQHNPDVKMINAECINAETLQKL